jgi:hypothetical protein
MNQRDSRADRDRVAPRAEAVDRAGPRYHKAPPARGEPRRGECRADGGRPRRGRTRRVRDHSPGRALPRMARSNDGPLSECTPQKPTLRERPLVAQSGRSWIVRVRNRWSRGRRQCARRGQGSPIQRASSNAPVSAIFTPRSPTTPAAAAMARQGLRAAPPKCRSGICRQMSLRHRWKRSARQGCRSCPD